MNFFFKLSLCTNMDKIERYFSDKLNEYVEIPCIYNVQVFKTTNDTIRRRLRKWFRSKI